MKVVVYRTEASLPPEERVVCKVPMFQYADGGVLDKSLLGLRLSLIVENNYGYVFDLENITVTESEPGFERIDIDPNRRGCTNVWINTEIDSTTAVKSLGSMLVEQGWKEDPMLADGGPTGIGAEYRKGDKICIVDAIWEPDAPANCPKDQPISACPVKLEQRLYTVALNCGMKTPAK